MKLFKKITASILACTLLMGSVSMITSAWFTTSNTSSQVMIKTTNSYTSSRLLHASVTDIDRATGQIVDVELCNYVHPQFVTIGVIVYRKSNLRYKGYGAIYNGTSSASGVASNYSINFN